MTMKNFLRNKLVKIYHYLQDVRYFYHKRAEVRKAEKQFLTSEEYHNRKLRRSVTKDIWRCFRAYHSTPAEYFLFGFRGKSHEYRNGFVTDHIKDSVMLREVGSDVFFRELKDKYMFYLMAGRYFKREAIALNCVGGGVIM